MAEIKEFAMHPGSPFATPEPASRGGFCTTHTHAAWSGEADDVTEKKEAPASCGGKVQVFARFIYCIQPVCVKQGRIIRYVVGGPLWVWDGAHFARQPTALHYLHM